MVARVPANAAAGTVTFPPPPIADSRSHTSVLVTRPRPRISCHIPARMSPPCREGIITAEVYLEYPQVITSTGSIRSWPAVTGMRGSGNHRSHWAIWPGS